MNKMRKINDRVLAGLIAGVGANLVKTTIELTAYKMGYCKRLFFN